MLPAQVLAMFMGSLLLFLSVPVSEACVFLRQDCYGARLHCLDTLHHSSWGFSAHVMSTPQPATLLHYASLLVSFSQGLVGILWALHLHTCPSTTSIYTNQKRRSTLTSSFNPPEFTRLWLFRHRTCLTMLTVDIPIDCIDPRLI